MNNEDFLLAEHLIQRALLLLEGHRLHDSLIMAAAAYRLMLVAQDPGGLTKAHHTWQKCYEAYTKHHATKHEHHSHVEHLQGLLKHVQSNTRSTPDKP